MMNKKNHNKTTRTIGLTVEEQKKFTKFLLSKTIEEEPYRNIFLLQMYLGLRLSEVLSLQQSDIDLKNNLICINKTLYKNTNGDINFNHNLSLSPRYVPIEPNIKKAIEEQMNFAKDNTNNLLFVSKDKDFVNSLTVNARLGKLLEECGIKSGCSHKLRQTCFERLLEIGVHPAIVYKWLGINSIKPIFKITHGKVSKWEKEELTKVNNYYNENNFFKDTKIKKISLNNLDMER